MISPRYSTAKQLIALAFFLATFLLLMGLFLSAVRPVNAQVAATGTATSSMSGGVPVTGSVNRKDIDLNQLMSYTVVDRNGTQIGSVNSFVMDLRNASVCASASSSSTGSSGTVSATAMATGTAVVPNTGSTMMGLKDCAAPATGQAAGAIAYLVVDRTGMTSGTSGSVSSTPVATSSAGGAVAGTAMVETPVATSSSVTTGAMTGNLVPVPWRFVRINLDQHTLIVDATQNAFNSAPGFTTSDTAPDFFGTQWQTDFSKFWNNTTNVATGAIPNTGGAAQVTSTVAATVTSAATATEMPTVASTVAATEVATSTVAPTEVATSTVAATSPVVETSTVAATVAATSPVVATSTVAATSTEVATSTVSATSSAPATVQAPSVSGSPTALVPVTGVDLGQVQEAAAAQQRMIVDVGIVGVGLVLLALGIVIKTGKK